MTLFSLRGAGPLLPHLQEGEEKQRNRRKLTEGTEWDLDRETGVPSQLTVEAVVNQFHQLLENDGKRAEIEMIFRSSQSFSVPMAAPSMLSSGVVIVSRLTAKTQIAFVSSVPSVYSVCSVVSLLSRFCC